MRNPFSTQARLDCATIGEVKLNLKCRDELVPVLAGLRHIYSRPQLRDRILGLVAADVNEHSRNDHGREGLDYWHIIDFNWRRIRDNICLLKPGTIEAISHCLAVASTTKPIDSSPTP